MNELSAPFVDLANQHKELREEIMASIAKVFDHGQFVFGQEVELFERQFAEFCGAKFAIGLNSGLDALLLGLRSLGVGPGDEVITPPNSYIASSGAIGLLGARPVFVDVRGDYNIDPNGIEAVITDKTKAIMPVHLTGRPCEMDAINDIADRHGISVIEDAAQAVTAKYKDRLAGTLGDLGCFSLHPLKTLNACGDGGVVTTNDPALYKRISQLRNHGLQNRDECAEWGYNSRLDSIQAAILLTKLKHISKWTAQRRANAHRYIQGLQGIGDLILPSDKEYEFAAYHTFIVRSKLRDKLQSFLNAQNIGAGVHYPIPIHLQPAANYLGYSLGDMPETEAQAAEILSLPVHQGIDASTVDFVIDAIRRFYTTA